MRFGAAFFGAATLLAASAMAMTSERAPVADEQVQGKTLPRKLSDYRFFDDLARQVPAEGVTPYRLNTPLWSDGAEKLRFVYVPPGTQALADGEGLLRFPIGTALIKTFAFGEGAERRLIETRVLLNRPTGWVALPYLWNEEQTEATLAVAGARLPITTPAGEQISYRVPNKNQCKECHGLNDVVVPIGPKARNLSRQWLTGMVRSGRLDAMPDGADVLPVWEERTNAPADLAARAYLEANCAHCHRPGATASNSGLDLRWEQDDPHALGIMKRPVAAGRGAGDLLFDVIPGKPDQSILLYRMESPEPGVAMPELGKSSIDGEGTEAVRRWIEQLPAQ